MGKEEPVTFNKHLSPHPSWLYYLYFWSRQRRKITLSLSQLSAENCVLVVETSAQRSGICVAVFWWYRKVTSTRVRRPGKIRSIMRGSKMDWSLGQEKPGRNIGLSRHDNGDGWDKVREKGMWGTLGSRRLVRSSPRWFRARNKRRKGENEQRKRGGEDSLIGLRG